MPWNGAPLNRYRCRSFKGGLDVKRTAFAIAGEKDHDRLTLADNVVYTTEGGVTKRYDTAALNSSSLGASVAITGGVQFRLSNGTDYDVCGTNDGRVVKLNSDGTTTNLVTGLTSSVRWSFAVFEDELIICNGADAPRSWDGTTFGSLAGSPPSTGQVVAVHNNRVWMTTANTSTLYFSSLSDAHTWSGGTSGTIEIDNGDGSTIKALTPTLSELIILKGKRPYRLQGNTTTTYAITNILPAVGSVGTPSTQGACFAVNDVYWVSESGVHRMAQTADFGDLKETFVSEKVEGYFRPNTAYSVSLNKIASTSCICYDPSWSRLYVALDDDNDGANDILLVYDVALSAWSKWDMAVASMWTRRNATTGVIEVLAGGYDGYVRALNRSASTNAIDGHFKHISDLGATGVEKSVRHVFVYVNEETDYDLTVTPYGDFGSVGGTSTTVSLLGGSHTLGVNWTLGTDPLGARSQIVKRINMNLKCEFLELGFRNNNAGEPFTVLGYEVFWRPRRDIRRAGTS